MLNILVALLLLALFFIVPILKKYRDNMKLKYWASLAAVPDERIKEILRKSQKKEIEESFRITGDKEWEFVSEVIISFQKILLSRYFSDSIPIISSKESITDEDFFMYSLYKFLNEHICDGFFLGHGMHIKRIEYTPYSEYTYDATYALSDFGLVVQKLHYLSFVYSFHLEREKKFKKYICNDSTKEGLEKNIQTKRIEICCYN